MDLNLSFDLRVEPLSKYHLDDISHRLRGGEIVALDDQYTFFCNVSRAATTCWQLVLFLIFITSIRCGAGYRLIAFIAISRLSGVYLDASTGRIC